VADRLWVTTYLKEDAEKLRLLTDEVDVELIPYFTPNYLSSLN
jgi:hypothetical protein